MNNVKFEEDKLTLIEASLSIVDNIDAIIMYGGYGRGEGAWVSNKGGALPYNDYDILIISNSTVDKGKLLLLRKELAKKIGISWVDISIMKKKKLKRLKPSIFNFDLKNGSEVIYGDSSIQDSIPEFKPSNIPLKEIRILFYTRLFTLIGSFETSKITNGFDSGQEVMFFKNQLAKATLACVDCLLIMKGHYDSSYKERVQKVLKLYSSSVEDEKLFLWALNEKLSPSEEGLSSEETKCLYQKVERKFKKVMLEGLAKMYELDAVDPNVLFESYLKEPGIRLRRFFYMLRRSTYFERVLAADKAQMQFLFCNLFSDSCDKELLNELFEEYMIDSTLPVSERFELLRGEIANMRLAL